MSDETSGRPAASVRATAERVRALIDLTDLADDRSPNGIDDLCDRALEHRTAAVCVWPEFVARCCDRLDGSGIRVATVVNFPTGSEAADVVVEATERAIADGADDIDVVIPYTDLLAGDGESAANMLAEVRRAAARPTVLKVILESGELASPDRIVGAAEIALAADADFLKTSTGKTPVGATHEAAHLMLAAIRASGRSAGLKPSGGISTVADAASYLALADEMMGPEWATAARFRFGASSLLGDVIRVLGGTTTESDPDTY